VGSTVDMDAVSEKTNKQINKLASAGNLTTDLAPWSPSYPEQSLQLHNVLAVTA
jgi:hypothetical protein